MPKKQPFLVNGRWRRTRKTFEVRRPFDNRLIARVCVPRARDVEDAIQGAARAFKLTRKTPSHQRGTLLWRVYDALKAEHTHFSRLIAQEAGKPLKQARAEVDRALTTLYLSAEESRRIGGEVFPADISQAGESKFAFTKRFPVGPVSAITPFNFPLNLVMHKVGPAFAAGCPVVVKPSERTPLTALELGRLFVVAGAPAGSISVLPADRDNASAFVEDERFRLLSFTGSASVGWHLKSIAGTKKVVLELGGNAGVIVDADADVETAAKKIAAAAYGYAGQSCISVQRVLVHEKIYAKFKKAMRKYTKRLKVGDPLSARTDVGPLINQEAAERVEDWISEAKAMGGRVVYGGKRTGAFITPTILERVPKRAKCYKEEAFAPLSLLIPFSNFNSALREVNNSRYGLQAGVFTNDINKALRAFHELDVGGVLVNDVPTYRIDNQPYGGVKDSGLGREGVKYAIEDMTELRVALFESPKRFM